MNLFHTNHRLYCFILGNTVISIYAHNITHWIYTYFGI